MAQVRYEVFHPLNTDREPEQVGRNRASRARHRRGVAEMLATGCQS